MTTAKKRSAAAAGSDLSAAVCSITTTQRRRFFWAAWWTEPPCERPFRKPDASNGGAATWEEAKAEAERAAGRVLGVIGPEYARAWMKVLRGAAPEMPRAKPEPPKQRLQEVGESTRLSSWALLGLTPDADVDAIKRAYRRRALETHPDRGGDPEVFRAIQAAYERALAKRQKADKRPVKKTRRAAR